MVCPPVDARYPKDRNKQSGRRFVDAQKMSYRLNAWNLGEVLGRDDRVILPAGVGEYEIAGREPGAFDSITSATLLPAMTALVSSPDR